MDRLAEFSALLLDLYRYARELPLADFPTRALRRLQDLVPFDSAWWGMARMPPSREPEMHCSFLFNQPPEFAEFWETIKLGDTLAQAGHNNPGVTIYFDAALLASGPGISRLAARYGLSQALSTQIINPGLNLLTFLSLYRHEPEPAFSEEERLLKQHAMPHLVAVLNSNWIFQLEKIRAHSTVTRVAMAIVDRHGVLLSAEPYFFDLMRAEWPTWRGPSLPAELAGVLRMPMRHVGAETVSTGHRVGDLYLLEIRARSVADRLSTRERTIAASFAEGRSYKEIAESLQLSPATVRHHLRHVYEKLGVSDKAALSRLLSADDAASVLVRPEAVNLPEPRG